MTLSSMKRQSSAVAGGRAEERRAGEVWSWTAGWSSGVCSSDLSAAVLCDPRGVHLALDVGGGVDLGRAPGVAEHGRAVHARHVERPHLTGQHPVDDVVLHEEAVLGGGQG